MVKTRKVKSAGRFGSRYGKSVRERISKIEAKQKVKQTCPFCQKKSLKRLSKGIWLCKKCGKKTASHAYYIE